MNETDLITLAKKTIREEIKYNYYHSRFHGRTDSFKKTFLLNDILGRIENNEPLRNTNSTTFGPSFIIRDQFCT